MIRIADAAKAKHCAGDSPQWHSVDCSSLNWVARFWRSHNTLSSSHPGPAFMLSGLYEIAVVLPTLLFFAWHPGLFRGEAKIPKRSYVLFLAATALSVVYFVGSWKWGLLYQGIQHTRIVCGINVAWIVFLALAFAPGTFHTLRHHSKSVCSQGGLVSSLQETCKNLISPSRACTLVGGRLRTGELIYASREHPPRISPNPCLVS
jgi:hypothetical protein